MSALAQAACIVSTSFSVEACRAVTCASKHSTQRLTVTCASATWQCLLHFLAAGAR